MNKPAQFLSDQEADKLIAKFLAHKFCDGILWVKSCKWDRKGPILVYDYSYIGKFYYLLRHGYFEESTLTASDKEGFSIFSHTPCPLYASSVSENGSKSNERRKDVVSSIPHILKILSRRKRATDIKMQQLRFATT